METSEADGNGVSIETSGGAVTTTRDASRRKGTTVKVEQLFYNVPARRKFLRSARSEWRSIAETLNSVALSRPDVRFSLSHDGKEVLTLPPVSSLRARVSGIWGGKYAGSLLDVDDVAGVVLVSGAGERPGDVGKTTRRGFVAGNGRVVRDNGNGRDAQGAFRSAISDGP